MTFTPGARVGAYEIVTPIGAGGMGEVFRARDTALGRDVAIKVLPELFAADADRLARFEREARVLATLSHPNIATIHGLERTGATVCLIMELALGETLAARITRGSIPLDEALPIAMQIADALEAAHEKGVIHRDLKPANIVVSPDGKVKVLDFGIAKLAAPDKAAEAGLAGHNLADSPTMAHAGTMAGMILGTAAYMSPEQARGKAVDKRADIWAFGCVVFEMITGRAAFEGETLTDVVAAVINTEPDWSTLPPEATPSLRSALRRCLTKDPSERLHDIVDARIEIAEAGVQGTAQAGAPQPPRRSREALMALASAAAAAIVTFAGLRFAAPRGQSSDASPVARLELNMPAGVEMYAGNAPGVAFAPDGRRVAFIGIDGGERRIYVRSLDHFEAARLRGTEQAQSLFFAPDGGAIGFMTADRTVKKVSLSDGLITVIAHNADQYSGATWGPDGRITYTTDGRLAQTPSSGGPVTPLTNLDASRHELFHMWPVALPASKGFLFRSVVGDEVKTSQIEALSTATGQRHVLVAGLFPMYSPSGHLIFCRDHDLLAAPFDVQRLALTGPAVRIVSDVGVDFNGAPLASLSPTGSLVYAPGGTGTSSLVWVSRDGVEQRVTDSTRRYQSPRLAPNGRAISVQMGGNLWIHDTVRNTFARATPEETIGTGFTTWAPDGKHLAFRSREGMRWLEVEGGGRSQPIRGSSSVGDIPNSVSPDGETLVFTRQDAETSGDIYTVSLNDGSPPRPVVKTQAYEGGAQFSPDGRWLAYASNDSGQFQVYLRPYPGPERRVPVSTLGGSFPLWRRDGKELFYRNANKMMEVDVSLRGTEVSLSTPRVLFDQRYTFETSTIANYDIGLDGQRFLMVKDEFGAGRLNIILNWFTELQQRVPTR